MVRVPAAKKEHMFSKAPAIFLFFTAIVSFLTWVLGLTTLAALFLAERIVVVRDAQKRHGISDSSPSRLGGVAIFVSMLVYVILAQWMDDEISGYIKGVQSDSIASYAFLALIISLVGLADDLNEGLSPGFRMLLLSGIVLFAPSLNQDWLPLKLFRQDLALTYLPMVVIVPVTAFVLIGFKNAGNMIDGANGLLGGISLMWFVVLFDLQGSYYFFLLSLALLAFTLHNLFFSTVILGDFGSFGLSSLIVLSSFQVFEDTSISIWFFSAMLSYPCFEIVRVIILRLKQGESPFMADNQHIHNFLFRRLSSLGLSNQAANSLTGLLLALASSFTAFTLYFAEVSLKNDVFWLCISIIQFALFLAIWLFTGNFKQDDSN